MITTEEGYARSLLLTAEQGDCLERVYGELGPVSELLLANAEFFLNPVVPAARRTEVLRRALEGSADPLTVEFLCLLIRRHAMKKLAAIRQHFDRLAAEQLGRMNIRVRIPFEPDAGLMEKILASLVQGGLVPESKAARASIEVVIDKSLLGGFTAEYKGWLLDRSLKSRLSGLRRSAIAGYPGAGAKL